MQLGVCDGIRRQANGFRKPSERGLDVAILLSGMCCTKRFNAMNATTSPAQMGMSDCMHIPKAALRLSAHNHVADNMEDSWAQVRPGSESAAECSGPLTNQGGLQICE